MNKEKSKRRIMTQNKNKTLRSDQRGIAKGKDIRLKLKGTKQKKNHRVNNQMIYRRIEEKQIGGKEKMAETESYFKPKKKKKKNSTGY